MAAKAIQNVALNDFLGMAINETNHNVINQDRNMLRQTLTSIDNMTEFKQPSWHINTLNESINKASKELDREDNAIKNLLPKAVEQTEKEIKQVGEKGWFFKGSRIEGKKKDIEEIKSFNTAPAHAKLEQLARSNYDNGVKMLEGFSI